MRMRITMRTVEIFNTNIMHKFTFASYELQWDLLVLMMRSVNRIVPSSRHVWDWKLRLVPWQSWCVCILRENTATDACIIQ